jgi:hypothetical protein
LRWTRQITIAGDPETVYGLVADLERWPRLLPHVGYERFGVLVVCTCRVTRSQGRVSLLHVAGHAAGLGESWLAEPTVDGGTCLTYVCGTPRETPARRVAARLLVLPLAERALDMFDLLAEADRLARRDVPSATHTDDPQS